VVLSGWHLPPVQFPLQQLPPSVHVWLSAVQLVALQVPLVVSQWRLQQSVATAQELPGPLQELTDEAPPPPLLPPTLPPLPVCCPPPPPPPLPPPAPVVSALPALLLQPGSARSATVIDPNKSVTYIRVRVGLTLT
jgi:hypothetical protein